jgi:hypothetical protein
MARESHDREDLLAEATALVERVELLVEGEPQPLIAGFRRDGCLSLFFGPEPVYQFNTQRALRRAYVAGRLYKAETGRLVAVDRQREEGILHLLRHELDELQMDRFMSDMSARLARLQQAFAHDRYTVAGQVPTDAPVTERVRDWLARFGSNVTVAQAPHAR